MTEHRVDLEWSRIVRERSAHWPGVLARVVHLPLLALWAVAAFFVARSIAAESHFQTALQFANDPDRHIAQLSRALELNPLHGFAHAALGRIYLARKEWEGAVRHSRRALQLQFNLELVKQLGSAYFRSGNILEAYRTFEETLTYLPNDRDSLFRLGQLNIILQRPEVAERVARRFIDFHSATGEAYWILGKAAELRNRHRQAMHCFHRFLMRSRSEALPEELYENIDWVHWLQTWDYYIRQVEKGEIVPQPGLRLD